jgi:hypothetical protein
MGICWSEPPPPPVAMATPLRPCKQCATWSKLDYCERCLQMNAYYTMKPSAPPLSVQPPVASYATSYPQQTYAYPQQQMYYYQPPVQYPPQQRQMGTGAAMATGFVVGAIMEDILDPH